MRIGLARSDLGGMLLRFYMLGILSKSKFAELAIIGLWEISILILCNHFMYILNGLLFGRVNQLLKLHFLKLAIELIKCLNYK